VLKQASREALGPPQSATFLPSPDAAPLAVTATATEGGEPATATSAAACAQVTLTHSTHVEGVVHVLKKLCARFSDTGIKGCTPAVLSTVHNYAEEFSIRVQRETGTGSRDGRATSYKAVARKGSQVQDVHIVVDPDRICDAATLQCMLDTVMDGKKPQRLPAGPSLFAGPLNIRAGSKESHLHQKSVRSKQAAEHARTQTHAAERKHEAGIAKTLRQLKARVPGADRALLEARATQNHELDMGRRGRGRESFGGRVNQIK
jgi:hypothetical protein